EMGSNSSFTAERRIEYDLIVPPELLKEGPCHVDGRLCLQRRQRPRQYLADATTPIDGIEHELFRLIDRQEQNPARVGLADHDTGRLGREPVTNTDRVWRSNGHVAEPCGSGESDPLRSARVIVSVGDDAVANHRAAEKFDGGKLLRQGKLFQSGSLRD